MWDRRAGCPRHGPHSVTRNRMKSILLAALLAAACLVTPALAAKRPHGWPSHRVELGLTSPPGGAAALRRSAPFRFRYQYLAGGVNTGAGWSTWNPNGTFVSTYAHDSVTQHVTPVFTYYMIRTSLPGKNDSDEQRADLGNLQNVATMKAYYQDLELFFRRANESGRTTVLHVEPDLWGYVEHVAAGDNAATVPAQVSATGLPELSGLPNDVSGFARAVVRLRDKLAPHVLLAYNLSIWGTGVDIQYSDPPSPEIDRLAAKAAAYYRSLNAHFDLTFSEFSDRDAGFKQVIYGDGGASWWNAADFGRNVRFLRGYSRAAHQAIAIWQIPLGNTVMRAENNTWGHFQDNRVQWLLGRGGDRHLRQYRAAGVIAYLFGGGADGTTCACDARRDGITDPPAINGNTRRSLSADDDGGLFRDLARRFYHRRALRI
jgi:hypothetical protein